MVSVSAPQMSEQFSALHTSKCLLSWMNTQMLRQVTFLRKCLTTINTCKRLLPRMDTKVVSKVTFLRNAFPHWLHTKGFSPEWIRRWVIKLDDTANAIPHWLQTYGFSPEWVRRWTVKQLLWENAFHIGCMWKVSPQNLFSDLRQLHWLYSINWLLLLP